MVAPYESIVEQHDEKYSELYEVLSTPETPRLKNFAKLFELPKGADNKNSALLEDAQNELVELFKRPIKMAKNTLSSDELTEGVRRAHTIELEKMTEALEFLDKVCKNPSMERASKTLLIADVDEKEGFRLKFSDEYDLPLGKIYEDNVSAVEIVIRTGQKATNEAYTPMQLNFRFLREDVEEISSLRVDLHNRNKGTNETHEVQLDMDLGRIKNAHNKIKALSSGTEEETRERFNVLLSAFTLNLVKNGIQNNENIIIGGESDKDKLSQKHLDKAVKRSAKVLAPQLVTETELGPEITAEQQNLYDTINEVQNAFTRVSKVSIAALAKSIDENSRDGETTVLAWLLGRNSIDFGNFDEIMNTKDRLTQLADFLKMSFPKQSSEEVYWVWDKPYPNEKIDRIYKSAEKLVVESNDTQALEDLAKLVSFMAMSPVEQV